MDLLSLSNEAFAEGRLHEAARLARRALTQARRQGDLAHQGRVLQLLGQQHFAAGRTRLALEAASNAARTSEAAGDVTNNVLALALVSHLASTLRHDDWALGAAQRSVELASGRHDEVLSVVAGNYLGVARFFRGHWQDAAATLHEARQRAERVPVATLRLRPAFNAAVCRIWKRLLDRGVKGLVEEDELQQLDDGLSASTIQLVMPAPTDRVLDGEAAIAWLQCFNAMGRGDLRWARECLRVCSANLQASPSVAVRFMRPYVRLAACELALMQGAWAQAVESADDALAAARQAENQQAAWLAQLLRLRALEADGRIEDALRGWKALYAQDIVRADALPSSREVPWRMPLAGSSGSARLSAASLGLTPAELAVLRLLCQGHTAPRIAALRGTSAGTVRIQLKALFSKTATGSQQELIARFAGDSSLFPAASA